MPVIDASVWVAAALSTDKHHAKAQRLLGAIVDAGESIHVPTLAFVEVAATMRRMTGSSPIANSVVARMRGVVSQVWDLDASFERVATQVAMTAGPRGADAVYIAVAMEASERLVTFELNSSVTDIGDNFAIELE